VELIINLDLAHPSNQDQDQAINLEQVISQEQAFQELVEQA
jgi:hypothetical protein